MNTKVSVFVICDEAIIDLLLYNLHDFTFKGNAQFIFLCNPQKSGASQVGITFLQVTQKKKNTI